MTSMHGRLADFYRGKQWPEDAWHVGPEHPALEEFVIGRLRRRSGLRVLEVGVQAGGFAVPVIAACAAMPGFRYTGLDNHGYPNAVPFSLLTEFLAGESLQAPVAFVESDGTGFLRSAAPDSFDLVLLDHYKPCYPEDLWLLLDRAIVGRGGEILLHDVLGNAAPEWPLCADVARAFGWRAAVHAEVPEGLAVLTSGQVRTPSPAERLWLGSRIHARWWRLQAHTRLRGMAGRGLRRLGLR